MGSTRLPGKMLMDLGGKPLIQWAIDAAAEAFGDHNVVVAIPHSAENDVLAEWLNGHGRTVFSWDGPENDVLGRFHACAHLYRWKPDSVIVRVTPDDPFKDPAKLRRVANGERLPVELGGEAFTLKMLDRAHRMSDHREHITKALFPTDPPSAPPGIWTIDTQEDLDRARAKFKLDVIA